jgi:hypothetical protein
MKPAAVDFTNGGNAAPGTLDRSQGADYRGNVQQLTPTPMDNNAGAIRVGADGLPLGGSSSPAAQETGKKKSFWQKLGIGKKE